MTATVAASGSTTQSDGGGDGKSFTTPAFSGTRALVVCVTSSSNADTIGTPGTGTWSEITLPDNLVTTSGGQVRVYRCQNPAASTAYAFTLTGGRRTLGWALLSGMDSTNLVDQASSLESAPGANHAPPSVTPSAPNELVLDWAFHRWFSPDPVNWSPPAAGLTWTEVFDVMGADTNNNCRLALGTATAGSAGVAVSTSPWTNTDTLEDALIVRILVKDAAGGTPTATGTSSARTATAATGFKTAAGAGRPTARTVSSSSTRKDAAGAGRAYARTVTGSTTSTVPTGTATATSRSSTTATGRKGTAGTATAPARSTATSTARKNAAGAATAAARTATAAVSAPPPAALIGVWTGGATVALGQLGGGTGRSGDTAGTTAASMVS